MADIHIKQVHQLSREEARERLQGIAGDLKKQLSFDYRWKGDSLHFKRSGATGVIELGDGFIDVKVKLGMVLAPMKGKIKQSIEKNIRTALA
jgi:putative polyhydroxyalkanoate system protein